MNTCPECGLETWHYHGDIFTCKQGHKHPRGEAVVVAPITPDLSPIWKGAIAGASVGALPGLAALILHFA